MMILSLMLSARSIEASKLKLGALPLASRASLKLLFRMQTSKITSNFRSRIS